MDGNYPCPNCGQDLALDPQSQNWFCQGCNQYYHEEPLAVSASQMREKPSTVIWIIVIVVLSMVVLAIFAGGMMYFLVTDMKNDSSNTPMGALVFEKGSNDTGMYTGRFHSLLGDVELSEASIIITDDSLGEQLTLDPIINGGTIVITNGLICSFNDVNGNNEIDESDMIIIENGEPGDNIRFVYRPTGGVIVDYTLT